MLSHINSISHRASRRFLLTSLFLLLTFLGWGQTELAYAQTLILDPIRPITVPTGLITNALGVDVYYIDTDVSMIDVVASFEAATPDVSSIIFTLNYTNDGCLNFDDGTATFDPYTNDFLSSSIQVTGVVTTGLVSGTNQLMGIFSHNIDNGSANQNVVQIIASTALVTMPFNIDASSCISSVVPGIAMTKTVTLDYVDTPVGGKNTSFGDPLANNVTGHYTDTMFTLRFNTPPTATQLITNMVDENLMFSTTITITDADIAIGDYHQYELVSDCVNNDNSDFKLTGSYSSTLESLSTFDSDITDTYHVCIKATDWEGASFTDTLTVTVRDLNESPIGITLTGLADIIVISDTASITENMGAIHIGTLTTDDPDIGDSHTYAIVAGTDIAAFDIITSTNSATLTSVISFDFEALSSYTLTVQTTDSAALTTTQTFTIEVLNENETPLLITLTNQTIAENSLGNIGDLFSSDTDGSYTHIFSLDSNPASTFAISPATTGGTIIPALVTGAGMLDFETVPTYTIMITATDEGGLPISKSFVISVTDVNEPATAIMLSHNRITENLMIDTPIGLLTNDDPDDHPGGLGDNGAYTYTIQSSSLPITSVKVINSGGVYTLVSSIEFDHEALSPNDYFTVTIQVEDSGNEKYMQDFTIYVDDDNDGPTDINLSGGQTIAEGMAINTAVGMLTATDQDNPTDTHTYGIVDGTNVNNFTIEASAPYTLASNVIFDYEEMDSNPVTVTVMTTDSMGAIFTKTFAITVTDVNEAPSATDYISITYGTTAIAIPIDLTDDPEGHKLQVDSVEMLTDGSNAITGTDMITYTPAISGVKVFTYIIREVTTTQKLTAQGTITVTVVDIPNSEETEIVDVDPDTPNSWTFTNTTSGSITETITIEIPAGAVTGTVKLVYQEDPNAAPPTDQPAGLSTIGRIFSLDIYSVKNNQWEEEVGYVFNQPITITLSYDDSDLSSGGVILDENTLQILVSTNGSSWSQNGITNVLLDPVNNTFTFSVNHLTTFTLSAYQRPHLAMPNSEAALWGVQGMTVSVPISLHNNYTGYNALHLEFFYDSTYLEFDSARPLAANTSVSSQGPLAGSSKVEIDVTATTTLPLEAEIVNLIFDVKTAGDTSEEVRLTSGLFNVTADPIFTLTMPIGTISSVTGTIQTEEMLIVDNDNRGDCNGDTNINAADLSAIIIETFDTGSRSNSIDNPDGDLGGPEFWLYAYKDKFIGSPLGCDASPEADLNYTPTDPTDMRSTIESADLSCLVNILFGDSSCSEPVPFAAAQRRAVNRPFSYVSPAAAEGTVEIPIVLEGGQDQAVSADFTIEYDASRYAYEDITLNIPAEMESQIRSDEAGKVQVILYTFAESMPALVDGQIATLVLQDNNGGRTIDDIQIVNASLGDNQAQSIPMGDGSANLVVQLETTEDSTMPEEENTEDSTTPTEENTEDSTTITEGNTEENAEENTEENTEDDTGASVGGTQEDSFNLYMPLIIR